MVFISILLTSNANSEEDKAYIIVKSTVIDEGKRQPTWICLSRKHRCVHVAANKSIISIEPGVYFLSHIDFREISLSDNGTVYLQEPIKLRLNSGNIYFIGHIKLSNKSVRGYKIELEQNVNLILEACMDEPDIFEMYTLANINDSTKIKFSCNES